MENKTGEPTNCPHLDFFVCDCWLESFIKEPPTLAIEIERMFNQNNRYANEINQIEEYEDKLQLEIEDDLSYIEKKREIVSELVPNRLPSDEIPFDDVSIESIETQTVIDPVYHYFTYTRDEIFDVLCMSNLLYKIKPKSFGTTYWLTQKLRKKLTRMLHSKSHTNDRIKIRLKQTQEYEDGFHVSREWFDSNLLFTPIDTELFFVRLGTKPPLVCVVNRSKFHKKFREGLLSENPYASILNFKIINPDTLLYNSRGGQDNVSLREYIDYYMERNYYLLS